MTKREKLFTGIGIALFVVAIAITIDVIVRDTLEKIEMGEA